MIKPINFNNENIIGFQMSGKITEAEIKAWPINSTAKATNLKNYVCT